MNTRNGAAELSMGEKAFRALQEAVAGVVEEHKRTGEPLAIVKDGRAQLVSPYEVDVGPDQAEESPVDEPLPGQVAEEAQTYGGTEKSVEERLARLEELVERIARKVL